MCSFLLTTWLVSNLTLINHFLVRRGPDATQVHTRGPFTFVHNLLHMTGERVLQPFVDGDVVAMYNGEIYNSRHLPAGFGGRHAYRSDGECILPSYRALGPRFPRTFDGEWALVLMDFAARRAVVSSDVFSTKPVWYSLHGGFHVASYASALERLGVPAETIKMANPNEIAVFHLDGASAVLAERHAVCEFDTRQFKASTEDWQAAFRGAVRKRVSAANSNHPVFVGLSSGYDSGALHLALEAEAPRHSVQYFTVAAEELPDVVERRLRDFPRSIARAWTVQLSLSDFDREKRWLEEYGEPFRYDSENWSGESVQEDGAAVGLSAIFRRCRRAGLLVYLSGAGADEVISDYGFAGQRFFPHSSFGGHFPDDLGGLFPWRSVFLGTQRDYLMKEEVVAGSHSLESRYPFLDRAVVQEYLWLTAEAKNALYKRPVHDLLAGQGYPFLAGQKEGFAASRNLKLFGATRLAPAFDAMLDGAQLLPRPLAAPLGEALSCAAGLETRFGAWRVARSRLATFVATPSDRTEVVEHLSAQLLQMLQSELQEAPECPLGEVSMRLLLALLMPPGGARARQLADEALWPVVAELPWGGVVASGWPLFGLLKRLSEDKLGEADGLEPSDTDRVLAEVSPSRARCGGHRDAQDPLDVPVAVLVADREGAHVAASQSAIVRLWQGRSFDEVLRSGRMCEAFAALEWQSQDYYRANLADAWHLLT